ncbi:hypothetical protein T03_17584 [Trichinella britovi]|uniref:Uncharacterized protein n=1 Tax=Trichinella britovi TaxID=45882 RepID=A0A0V1CFE2_TRIBR|nr:hypothetical protein T03_17584 [Trichinella britovi]
MSARAMSMAGRRFDSTAPMWVLSSTLLNIAPMCERSSVPMVALLTKHVQRCDDHCSEHQQHPLAYISFTSHRGVLVVHLSNSYNGVGDPRNFALRMCVCCFNAESIGNNSNQQCVTAQSQGSANETDLGELRRQMQKIQLDLLSLTNPSRQLMKCKHFDAPSRCKLELALSCISNTANKVSKDFLIGKQPSAAMLTWLGMFAINDDDDDDDDTCMQREISMKFLDYFSKCVIVRVPVMHVREVCQISTFLKCARLIFKLVKTSNYAAQITSLDSKSSRSLLELICNPKPDLPSLRALVADFVRIFPFKQMWRSIVRPVILVKGRGERNEVTKLKVLMERFKFMIEIQ